MCDFFHGLVRSWTRTVQGWLEGLIGSVGYLRFTEARVDCVSAKRRSGLLLDFFE